MLVDSYICMAMMLIKYTKYETHGQGKGGD